MKYAFLAYIAGGLSLISFVSLLHRVHFSKNTSSLPWYYLIINLSVQILYGIYAFSNKLFPILTTSIIFGSGLIYICYIKYKFPVSQETKEKITKKIKKDKNQ